MYAPTSPRWRWRDVLLASVRRVVIEKQFDDGPYPGQYVYHRRPSAAEATTVHVPRVPADTEQMIVKAERDLWQRTKSRRR